MVTIFASMEISDTPFQDYVSFFCPSPSCLSFMILSILQLHRHHDSGLLLAAIAESISSNGESVATKLLATDYEVRILVTTIQT